MSVRPTSRNLLAVLLSMLLAVGTFILTPVLPAAAAPGDFQCGLNTIYGTYYNTSNPGTTTLYRINAGTGDRTTVGTFTNGVAINALAISRDGDAAYGISTPASGSGTASLYRYGTSAAIKTLTGLPANAGIPAGGFNPATNDYWFATVAFSGSSATFNFYRVDLDSAASTVNYSSPTMTYTASGIGSGSISLGTDLTFDSRGRLYLVVSTNTSAYTNKLITFTPAQVNAGGPQVGATMVDLDAGAATSTFPGVAFGSSGYIYVQGASTLYEASPINGAQNAARGTSTAYSDLGSCANPTIIDTVRKNVVDRRNPTDQFTLSLSGTGFATPKTETAATPATGIQNEQISATVVLPNTTYNIAEAAANGANLNNYVTTWQCVNTSTDAVIASGAGATGSFTTPDTVATGEGAA